MSRYNFELINYKNLNFQHKSEIQEVIEKSDQSSIFDSLKWNMIIRELTNTNLFVNILYRNGVPVSFLYLYVKKKYLILKTSYNCLMATPFGGPIFVKGREHYGTLLLNNLKNYTSFYNIFLRLPPNLSKLNLKNFAKRNNSNISVINLQTDEDSQLAAFNKKKRWEIRKVAKSKFKLYKVDKSDIGIFFKYYKENCITKNITPYPKSLFLSIMKDFKKNEWDMLSLKDGNSFVSSIFLLKSFPTCFYWCSASNEGYRNMPIHTFLIWEYSKLLIKDNFTQFNLMGMDVPQVAKFKKGFNGELKSYSNFKFEGPLSKVFNFFKN